MPVQRKQVSFNLLKAFELTFIMKAFQSFFTEFSSSALN